MSQCPFSSVSNSVLGILRRISGGMWWIIVMFVGRCTIKQETWEKGTTLSDVQYLSELQRFRNQKTSEKTMKMLMVGSNGHLRLRPCGSVWAPVAAPQVRAACGRSVVEFSLEFQPFLVEKRWTSKSSNHVCILVTSLVMSPNWIV